MSRLHPDPPQRRRRRRPSRDHVRETEWGNGDRHTSRRLLQQRFNNRVRLVALVLLVCLAVLITTFVLRDESVASPTVSLDKSPAPVPVEYLPPPESPEEKTTAAMAVLDRFFGINDPALRLPLVFDPASESDDFLDYYAQQGRHDPEGIHDRKVTAILDKDHEILIVTFKDGQNRDWAAPFEWRINGYRLHWGSMTGYGELPWHRFLAERPTTPVRMRVNIYIPDTESPALIPGGHTFVLINHPDLTKPVGALLSPSSSLKPLLDLPRNTDIPANVSMQWLDFEGSGNWPVITDLIHRNWIR